MSAGISLSHIRKRFGSLVALDEVSLRISPGKVHGLLGENGAGKSTLMNVLYGLLRADSGIIERDGTPLNIRKPADSIAAGVGMVHQHFMLAGAMSVLDNVLLGDRRAGRWLDRATAGKALTELGDRLGLPIDPNARISDLSVGQQQRVEILKALYRQARVLVLDEPTAVLTPGETDQLMAAISRLRSEGKSIVFISHKLGEVKRICDEVTVLRRGKVVWEGTAQSVTARELARHMVGRDVEVVSLARARTSDSSPLAASRVPSRAKPQAAIILDNITAPGIHNVSLAIHPGEILGIAGVDGNGQQELAELVVGLLTPLTGSVTLNGRDVTRLSLANRQLLGVAHIPNDRKREGLIGSMTIARNIVLKQHNRRPFSALGMMNWWSIRKTARRLVREFDIRARSIDVPVATLSGGNAQKIILARELALADPKLIVAMNPVRGLDIGATNFVYEQLLARRAAGCAILLISSELDELLALCDRIGVLYNGRLTMSDFPRDGAEEIGGLMGGVDARLGGVVASATTAPDH